MGGPMEGKRIRKRPIKIVASHGGIGKHFQVDQTAAYAAAHPFARARGRSPAATAAPADIGPGGGLRRRTCAEGGPLPSRQAGGQEGEQNRWSPAEEARAGFWVPPALPVGRQNGIFHT